MNKWIAACAVLTSLVLAAPALAHHPVASASQVCNEDGTITLTATFENDFQGETTVTATDSQAGNLGTQTSTELIELTATYPGPSRDAGTVTFDWSADDGDEGSLEASYEAVSDCEGPPVAPPPDNNPPPEKPPTDTPPQGQHFPGGPNHSPPPSQPDQIARDTLPFSGPPPVAPVLLIGLGLLGAGIALRRLRRG